jgi:hypothetical protein
VKIDSRSEVKSGQRPPQSGAAAFRDTLKSLMGTRQKAGKPLIAAAPRAPSGVTSALATKVQDFRARSQVLQSARVGMNVEVKRLSEARAEAAATNEERMSSRLVDLLCKELVQEFVHGGSDAGASRHQEPSPSALPGHHRALGGGSSSGARSNGSATASVSSPEIQAKVAAAMALVERIATFVRSNRPALELSLGAGIDARVEVERTGKNEVALLVRGREGPPDPQDLSRIRDALAQRGLRLSSLTVG